MLTNHKLSLTLFFVVLAFAATLPQTHGGGGEYVQYDEYVKERAEVSYNASLNAYNPNPEDLADDLSELIGETLASENGTRRHLNQEEGCQATNPFDKCWRCDPNWAKDRKKLADCVRGFGHDTMGGKNGKFYLVTDPSDNNVGNPMPGTLRHAVIQIEPLWIIFSHNMVITLKQELIFTSDKTIDGRGVEVHIAYGAGLTLQFVQNIIIHNIWIHNIVPAAGGMIRDSTIHMGLRTPSDGDAISIYGSSRIWLDHLSLSNCTDGLIDVIEGSTAVTISNCKLNHHNDVMLLGAHDNSDKDKIMQVTVTFNRFGIGCIQRMPRCRWGFFHVVNNDYQHWELYAIGGSAHPTIISQGNRFRASDGLYTKEVTKRDYSTKEEWSKWQWRSEGDEFMNGAFFVESGPLIKHTKSPLVGQNFIMFRPGQAGRLTRNAGAIRCKEGTYC